MIAVVLGVLLSAGPVEGDRGSVAASAAGEHAGAGLCAHIVYQPCGARKASAKKARKSASSRVLKVAAKEPEAATTPPVVEGTPTPASGGGGVSGTVPQEPPADRSRMAHDFGALLSGMVPQEPPADGARLAYDFGALQSEWTRRVYGAPRVDLFAPAARPLVQASGIGLVVERLPGK